MLNLDKLLKVKGRHVTAATGDIKNKLQRSQSSINKSLSPFICSFGDRQRDCLSATV